MGFCNYLCKLSPFVGNLLIYSRTKNVVLIALNTIRRLKTCQMVGLTSNFDKIFRGFNYSAGDAAPTNEIRLSLLKEKRCESRYNICSIKYHSGNKILLLATCHIFTSISQTKILHKPEISTPRQARQVAMFAVSVIHNRQRVTQDSDDVSGFLRASQSAAVSVSAPAC